MGRAGAAICGVLLVAACAGPGTAPSSTGSAPVTSSTTSPPTTTTSTTTTLAPTTTPAPTTTTGPASPPTTMPPADGPSGSGCTPGDAATLPEGEWFGFVSATSATSIDFDLACWFGGQAAVEAAAEDGEESPPPNDYYVRNENPQARSLIVSTEARVVWYPTGDPTSGTESGFEEWSEGVASRGFMFGVWIEVIDGEVLRIREQWVP